MCEFAALSRNGREGLHGHLDDAKSSVGLSRQPIPCLGCLVCVAAFQSSGELP